MTAGRTPGHPTLDSSKVLCPEPGVNKNSLLHYRNVKEIIRQVRDPRKTRNPERNVSNRRVVSATSLASEKSRRVRVKGRWWPWRPPFTGVLGAQAKLLRARQEWRRAAAGSRLYAALLRGPPLSYPVVLLKPGPRKHIDVLHFLKAHPTPKDWHQ